MIFEYLKFGLHSINSCLLLMLVISTVDLVSLSYGAPLNLNTTQDKDQKNLELFPSIELDKASVDKVVDKPPLLSADDTKKDGSKEEQKQIGAIVHAVSDIPLVLVDSKDQVKLNKSESQQLAPKVDFAGELKFVSHKPQAKHDNFQMPKHIVPLKLDEVQPPDHIDGLRVEQDGHLNADYKKEIFMGNHEEFEHSGSEKKLLSRLKIVFIKADSNHDSFLTHEELKDWIILKVQEHLQEASAENARIFSHLDTNHDGFVSWKEFHVHFLLAKGHDQNETLKHADDYEALSIDSDDRERLIRYKFRWADADVEPQDNMLTVDEMKSFRHPEQSSTMLIRMAKDLIQNLDHNEDGIITEEEFIELPRADLDDMMHDRRADDVWQNERRKEFRDVIDINHDGKVDVDELKLYVDPHNENHAHLEADNLIQLADMDSDGKLSIEEILDNAELFLGSKMVNTGRNFHDEF